MSLEGDIALRLYRYLDKKAFDGRPRFEIELFNLCINHLGLKATTYASKLKGALGELRGKKSLLITFFPRCFTSNCTSQLTSLRDAYPQLQKAGVRVWAVSTDGADGPHGQRAFAKYLRLPFTLLPDPDRKLCLQFGVVRTKEQLAARMSGLIDKSSQVLWIDKQISPRTHGADVLSRLKAIPALSAPPSPASATTSSAPNAPDQPSTSK